MNTFETLKAMPLFANLDQGTIEKLGVHLKLQHHRAGEVVTREGDPADAFFIVHQGSVWVTKGENADAQSVVVLGRGSHFGEVGILLEGPRTATVTAAEDAQLLCLTTEAADQVLLEEPHAAAMFFRALAVSLADRLRATTDDYAWLRQSLR